MAPVYALMISFMIVFLAGFAVDRSQPAAKTIQFTASGVNSALVDLSEATVYLFDPAPRTSKVDRNGMLEEPTPDHPYTVCVELPAGWSAKGAKKLDESGYTCWGPLSPGQDVELQISKSK